MAGRIQSNEKPVFADEVMISLNIKKSRDGKKKDAAVRMGFVDSLRKEIVSEVILSPITAEALVIVLQKSLTKLEDIMKGKIEKRQDDSTTYIG